MKFSYKKLLLAAVIAVCTFNVFSLGRRDVSERNVENKDSWQETFDINDKKAGKYNIYVEAEDQGGNTEIAGPYNLYIDPDSDFPVSGITNPSKNMRVQGNLNIVGTCVDDDGVENVYLILDGGEPVKANGKEFWSYYLDTNDLAEGPHTIEVLGVDINGLSSAQKPKKKAFVTWNLDRRQPVTQVTNYAAGSLVSGKIVLKGTVYDGNGIKSLYRSLDNGKIFEEIKIVENKKTGQVTFECPIDTRKAEDGTAVCWFKAVDKMGSVGMYSFLYFIDNTKPDVKIVKPEANEVCNGKFGIAGFAKDTVGLQKLSWSCNGESGNFDLIPGNPYWYKEIDTRNMTAKTIDFFITATDTAGNVVQVKRTIPLNQEADKPVVQIDYPVQDGMITGYAGSFYLRGIAHDDDGGVASITYSLDDGLPVTMATEGVFYAKIGEYGDIPEGKHKITVSAMDKWGIKGNPVVVNFSSMGSAPEFDDPVVKTAEGTFWFAYGMKVHPESNPVVETAVSSEAKITAASYKIEWGASNQIEKTFDIKTPVSELPVSIPLNTPDIPWGLIRITVSATDSYDRTTEQKIVLNLLDLTNIQVDVPEVVFPDSRVSDNGEIINDFDHPVTGYFVGGKIKSVSLVPQTPFASVSFEGNTIILKAEKAEGVSQPVKVRVVTEQNIVYDSQELVFLGDNPAPVVSLDGERTVVDGSGNVHITGKISSNIPLTQVKFRIFSAEIEQNEGIITNVRGAKSSGFINLEKNNKIDFEVLAEELSEGMHAIEVVASNGKEASNVIFVKKLPPLPEVNPVTGKLVVPAKPSITWFDGNDVYAVAVYQGELPVETMVCPRSEMAPGNNELNFAIPYESGKVSTSKFTARKNGDAKVFIKSVGDKEYTNGMLIPLARNDKNGVSVVATIESDFPVSSLSYHISGEKTFGGELSQNGRAVVKKIDEKHYEAEFSLSNLPVRFTKIEMIAETAGGSAFYRGCVGIVRMRDESEIGNQQGVCWLPEHNVTFDSNKNCYVMKAGEKFGGYANVLGPISVNSNSAAFKAVANDGNYFSITTDKDGFYKNVSVKVYDRQKAEYVSDSIDVLVDSFPPEVAIKSPAPMDWVQDTVNLVVSASDGNGIASIEYSIDGGATWTAFAAPKSSGMDYTATLDLDDLPDGLVGIDVRAIDGVGKYGTASTGIFKDTTPPDVKVIIPAEGDLINGETLIVFDVNDNGSMSRSEFVIPPAGKTPEKANTLNLDYMVNTHVGTEEQPLSSDMMFRFSDVTGNKTVINKWDFKIDNDLDLPIAEVHLPVEDAVITRDFEFSGVIFDDDSIRKDEKGNVVAGPHILYKIDDGKYTELEQIGTSFAIPKKLSDFTDNEHTITVYAVDINGVKGPEYTRNFKISLEEPKGEVKTPSIDDTVRGLVKMSGVATDKNGIKAVYISVDTGNSYNEAIGNFKHEDEVCNWEYEFDTRVIKDGTHVVFLKVVDWYGVEALYSSLINIDNTKPSIQLELPLDGSLSTGMVFFSGQTTDNIGLKNLYVTVRSLDGKVVKSALSHIDLAPDEIITKAIDLSSLDNGFYNVELTGTDAADNVTRVSCNIKLDKESPKAKVDLLYPLNGEHVQGVFNVYGTAVSEVDIDSLELFIDDESVDETELSASGYYKFNVNENMISEGQHKIRVEAHLADSTKIVSNVQYLNYAMYGPWITIDNFTYGDFAVDRPYISGNSGYVLDPEDAALLKSKSKEISKEVREDIQNRQVAYVEISFDNGKSFEKVSSKGKWRYRVENKDIPEGYHFLIVRATMKNGETAVTRCIVQVDSTKPTIKLISPGLGGHYNQELVFRGLSHDDVALKRVTLALRQGDKSSYEVPSFIQGLYIDTQFWGATLFNVGAGLTFFDDNVKLQVQWGQFTSAQRKLFTDTQMRYGGNNVIGMKLLANVAYIPFRYLFGPDWEWLSANVALGANFTRFNESQADEAQFLSAVLAQFEFPRVTFNTKRKFLRTFSFYTEGQLWFIPTDVSSSVKIEKYVPQISIGLRANVF